MTFSLTYLNNMLHRQLNDNLIWNVVARKRKSDVRLFHYKNLIQSHLELDLPSSNTRATPIPLLHPIWISNLHHTQIGTNGDAKPLHTTSTIATPTFRTNINE